MRSLTFHVVTTPTGDRPYVSINKPESYIAHLDETGERAEVFQIEVQLPPTKDEPLFGSSLGLPGVVSIVTRIR